MLQASYPKEAYLKPFGYKEVKQYEKMAISILETCIPPQLPLERSQEFSHCISLINSWQTKESIPPFPSNMLNFEINELVPLCPPLQPGIDLLPEYREQIRIILVECDIIEMITSGIKPGMTKAEYRKMKEDLSVINELRHIAGGQPLFPDKN